MLLPTLFGFACRCFVHTLHRPHPSQPLSLTLFPSWRNFPSTCITPSHHPPAPPTHPPNAVSTTLPNIQPPERNMLPNPCLREHPLALCHISHTNPQTSVYQTLPIRHPQHLTLSTVCQTQHRRQSTSDTWCVASNGCMATPPTPLPITPSLLRSFRSFHNLSYPDHLTLWAAILLAFFAFLRSGELLSLHRSDLHRTADGYQVHIKQSKTDPFRSAPIWRPVPLCSHCPGLLPSDPGPHTTHSVPPPDSCPHAPPETQPPNQRPPTHPTPSAYELPQQQPQLSQVLGCWSSDCYRRYIRPPSSETNGIAAALAEALL